jgi:hypothetical protein
MAGWHESGRVGEVRDVLMWFADRRHDKKASCMTSIRTWLPSGNCSPLDLSLNWEQRAVGWHMDDVAVDARQEANS